MATSCGYACDNELYLLACVGAFSLGALHLKSDTARR